MWISSWLKLPLFTPFAVYPAVKYWASLFSTPMLYIHYRTSHVVVKKKIKEKDNSADFHKIMKSLIGETLCRCYYSRQRQRLRGATKPIHGIFRIDDRIKSDSPNINAII
jgi:hypothetical protein